MVRLQADNPYIFPKSIRLYENLKQLTKSRFGKVCFHLQEKYGYDLAFVMQGGASIATNAQRLINLVEQDSQGLDNLQQLLEEQRLLQNNRVQVFILSFFLAMFLAAITIILSVSVSSPPDSSPPDFGNMIVGAPSLSDLEFHTLGNSNTLQIIATLKEKSIKYASATVWEKTREYIIIITTYHLLKGAIKFEITAPHLEDKDGENFSKISSSELEVYIEPHYDLVFIKFNLTDESEKNFPWLKVQSVKKSVYKVQSLEEDGCGIYPY